MKVIKTIARIVDPCNNITVSGNHDRQDSIKRLTAAG